MKTLSKIASERSPIPVLNTILIRDGLARATNMDQYITYKTDIAPGLYTGKAFDQVRVPVKDIPESDFPECFIKIGDKLSTMVLPRETLEFVSDAASQEETRYYLKGIFFDYSGLVATNGHILLHEKAETGLTSKQGVIMPNLAIKFLVSIMKEEKEKACELDIHKNGFVARCGRYTLTTKHIDGTFPDYRRVIPQDAPCVGLINGDIARALKEAKPIYKAKAFHWASKHDSGVTALVIGAGNIGINGESYSWPCEISFSKPCGFNPSYLEKMPEGTAYSKGNQYPMRIDSGLRTGVIMPMRV